MKRSVTVSHISSYATGVQMEEIRFPTFTLRSDSKSDNDSFLDEDDGFEISLDTYSSTKYSSTSQRYIHSSGTNESSDFLDEKYDDSDEEIVFVSESRTNSSETFNEKMHSPILLSKKEAYTSDIPIGISLGKKANETIITHDQISERVEDVEMNNNIDTEGKSMEKNPKRTSHIRYNTFSGEIKGFDSPSTIGYQGSDRILKSTSTDGLDIDDIYSILDSTSSVQSIDEEDNDILPFKDVEYTFYEKGSEAHRIRRRQLTHQEDIAYFKHLYTNGTKHMELNEFLNTMQHFPSSPEAFQRGRDLLTKDIGGAIQCFYDVLISENVDAKYKDLSLMWILYLSHNLRKVSTIDESLQRSDSVESMNISTPSRMKEFSLTEEMEKRVAQELLKAVSRVELFTFQVGELYRTGRGIKQDPAMAYRWYTKASKCERFRTPHIFLGVCHILGYGCERNLQKAKAYFSTAVRLRDSRAFKYLARCCRMIDFETRFPNFQSLE